MASHYSKLSAVFLFALLQCFSPLLHAHFDTETHGLTGIHSHDMVELYCLDTERSYCSEARVEVLDVQAVMTAPAFPKQFSPPPDPAILPAKFSPWQLQARASFVTTPLPSVNVPRWHFASPPTHAPPYLL